MSFLTINGYDSHANNNRGNWVSEEQAFLQREQQTEQLSSKQSFLPRIPILKIIVICIFVFTIVGYLTFPSLPNQPTTPQLQKEQQISMLTSEFNTSPENYLQFKLQQLRSLYSESNNELALAKGLIRDHPTAIQIEFMFYDQKYNIDRIKQKSICIVASERNNMFEKKQKKFLDSVANLNYSNYRLVLFDDCSEDGSQEFTHRYLRQVASSQFRSKVQFIENSDRKYSLANKIRGIHEYCSSEDIIVDVDADDHFIGREIMHVINKVYENDQVWFFYTNYITNTFGEDMGGPNQAISQYDQDISEYRASTEWFVSHLKTYRRELFLKLWDKQWRDQKGKLYNWAADRFILYGLIELSGSKYQHFENIYPYYYESYTNEYRNFEIIGPYKYLAKKLTPYKPLNSLSDQAQKVSPYLIPNDILESYHQAVQRHNKVVEEQASVLASEQPKFQQSDR